jgi:hypothetical protein
VREAAIVHQLYTIHKLPRYLLGHVLAERWRLAHQRSQIAEWKVL